MANSTANIARSLTTRMNRKISDADASSQRFINRAFSTRRPQEKAPVRPEISLPLELLSATNPLAFTAPDIHSKNPSSATTASNNFPLSPAHTLGSTTSSNSLRSDNSVPGLSTTSSVTSSSPIQTPVAEASEHDFNNPEKRLTTLTETFAESTIESRLEQASTTSDEDKLAVEAPTVPKRAPSHTKKTHQALHRQRSLSRIGARSPSAGPRSSSGQNSLTENGSRPPSSSARSSGHLSTQSLEKDENGVKVVRNSIDIFSSGVNSDDASKDHPFGAELAKLDEMAEEFSPTKAKHDEPKRELRRERSFKALRRGLSRKGKREDKQEPEKMPEPEAETQTEAQNALQRKPSFKVLRRDPSTKELKPQTDNETPKLEQSPLPIQEQITVPRRDPSRRRAPTLVRDEQPLVTAPPPSKSQSIRRAQRPGKVAVTPSEPTIWDEESEYLNKHGLRTFTAEDYMAEIGSPFASTFDSSQAGWL